jgi:hypothetical protein
MLRKGLPALVLLLLVINLVMAAASAGLFGAQPLAGWAESPPEPGRLALQARTERLRLMAAGPDKTDNPRRESKAEGKADNKTTASAATDASKPAALQASASVPAASAADACWELGGLSAQAARQASSELTGQDGGKGLKIEQFEREEQVRWWIHLQPQPTRDDLDRKLAELKRRNITDYAVVPASSPESYTVSLGLFRERERAEHYLDTLRERGVRTAVLTDSPRALARQWLRVRDAGDAAHDQLEAARRRYGAEDLVRCGA